MIIYHKLQPIKLVPKKYNRITNITDFLEDFEYKRLREIERKSLDSELFRLEAENFLMYLSFSDPLVFERVKDASPVAAGKIKDADGENCTVLVMSNNLHVRCDEPLYTLSPIKINMVQKSNEVQTRMFAS